MTKNTILNVHGSEIYKFIREASAELCKPIASTMGPFGKTVMISNDDRLIVTKDGVTVARYLESDDKIKNVIIQAIKQASERTALNVGDGTTTAMALADRMIQDGFEIIQTNTNDLDISEFKVGMTDAMNKANSTIMASKKTIDKDDANEVTYLKQVATISANGDEKIGQIISDAVIAVGRYGAITVVNGQTSETSLKIIDGLEINKGMVSSYFVNNSNDGNCEFNNPAIFIYQGKVSSSSEAIQILKKFEECVIKNPQIGNLPLVVIAESFEDEALAVFAANKMKGSINICPVLAPAYGALQREILADISLYTHAEICDGGAGDSVKSVTIKNYGRCKKVVITKDSAIFYYGAGHELNKSAIKQRISNLESRLSQESNELTRERLRQRWSKLNNGIAVISVGGLSNIEISEKRDRVDDAVCATRAALEKGVVPGAGFVYLYAQKSCQKEFDAKLSDTPNTTQQVQSYLAGYKLVMDSLDAPTLTLLQNKFNTAISNSTYPETMLEKYKLSIQETSDECLDGMSNNMTTNLKTGEIGDCYELGIIDPVLVSSTALESATSIASMLLSTSSLLFKETDIAPFPEQQMM